MPTILLRRRDIFYNYQSHHDCSRSLFEEKIFAPLLFSTLHSLFLEEKKQSFRKDLSTIDPLELNLNRLIDSLSLSLFLFLSQWTKRKFDNINRDCLDTVPPQ